MAAPRRRVVSPVTSVDSDLARQCWNSTEVRRQQQRCRVTCGGWPHGDPAVTASCGMLGTVTGRESGILSTLQSSLPFTPLSTPASPACSPDPRSRLESLDPVFLIYYLGSLALVMVVNVTGNALVLRTLYRHRCLWLPSNVFICSLGISDLLFGPIYFLYNVAGVNSQGVKDVFGDWSACRVLLLEVLALEICSAYTLVAITVTRYIGSKHALRYNHYVTFRYCIATVVMIWVTSHVACIIVYAVQIPYAVSTGAYCRVCRYEAIYTARELGLLTVFQFALPFTLMLVFYLHMICHARKLNKRVTSESFCTNDIGSQQSRATISQRQHKSFVIITLLIGCFALSYVPMIVYFFLVIVKRQPKTDHEYLSATSRIFMCLNTAVNVFIYAGRMSDFRDFLHRDVLSACSLPIQCRDCSRWLKSSDTSLCPAVITIVRIGPPPSAAEDLERTTAHPT
ncbi:adrenocorticotropic hormone receptor-like [Babylonia areolata]|uniref:adrenocorticotropic hormone receptor-like n=1 Tax=Babylonia areolata TaxID=304850 RepID=UPI003FCF5BE4